MDVSRDVQESGQYHSSDDETSGCKLSYSSIEGGCTPYSQNNYQFEGKVRHHPVKGCLFRASQIASD